jgi:transglutaminase/protease-like cytokinesis protein 3
VAEVEAKAYLRDQDGDLYEDADSTSKKRVLSQPNWYQTTPSSDILTKRYIVKALIPGDEGNGVLKIYAGKKGLMHSAREIVHPLALAVPLYHTGENPAYEFVRRHPTPHATRQDLYVIQPQCFRLAAGETYVFCVRQHPANYVSTPTPQNERNGFDFRPLSPNPLMRPASALSMTSSAMGGSQQGSDSSSTTVPNSAGVKVKEKPAKLAVQSPSGKIIRLSRKLEGCLQPAASKEADGLIVGSVWESIVKVAERGVWRGLVLADRSARWCVWGEWECS